VLAAWTLGLPARGEAKTYCGTTAQLAVIVEHGTPPCAIARDIIRRYDRSIQAHHCAVQACPKRIGTWRCSTASAGQFPRLHTCARTLGHATVSSYITAE